jgi:hypothetical protein
VVGKVDELAELAFNIVMAEEIARKIRPRQKGFTHSLRVVVEGLTVIDFVSDEPHSKLFSITVYNDGNSEVYVSVNTYERNAPLKPHETLSIKYDEPVIEKLFLDVDEGKSTEVRVFGIY